MRLPAYGGTLFDPDRYPFLEGRTRDSDWKHSLAAPLLINNRVVLHLLEALQLLRVRVPGGGPSEARRLSFRALDIEQIGHVYEGLLDHTAVRADEPVLGLAGAKDKEPEVPLAALEEIARKGTTELVEFLRESTGRSDRALKRIIDEPPVFDSDALLMACGQDERLAHRIKAFAPLLRADSFGHSVVIRPGSVYVTGGSDRRSTGTHYTPRSLTEPIVKHTLEPLVYIGPADGLPEREWTLKTPKELLALRVCDMAMGSGAFLVESCRYLADRLVEAWENAEREHPGSFIVTPDGGLSTGASTERLIPAEPAERIAIARRLIADRCLYGVDVNPMAVEMAKLSLWLVTLQRDRPFTFLDHALKCGDSLIGISSIRQIERFSLRRGASQITFDTPDLSRSVAEASAKRQALEELPSNDSLQIDAKRRLLAEAAVATATANAVADTLTGLELRGLDGDAYEEQRAVAAAAAGAAMRKPLHEFVAYASEQVNNRRTFNWPLEFPEVFVRGGFDAFVGNPPFVGGRRMRMSVGDSTVTWLSTYWPHASLNADFCAFFFLRGTELLKDSGAFGWLATKTIAQGDTARTGLCYLVDQLNVSITYARSAFTWPGTASVVAALVVGRRGSWNGTQTLDGRSVNAISCILDDETGWGEAKVLSENVERSFQGSVLVGLGFVLSESEARQFIALRKESAEVVHPYLGGEDLNTNPDQKASRWAIDFRDYPLEQCEKRWPELMTRVRTLVKPQRDGVRRDAHRKYWWHHGDKRPELYRRIKDRSEVFVIGRVTKYVAFVAVPAAQVFHDKVYVFDLSGFGEFAPLQASFHDAWVRRGSSTVGETLNYTPSDYFDTYPFLHLDSAELESIGDRYHRHRQTVMLDRQLGLTDTYNLFHKSDETAVDIQRLRDLHRELDQSVADAYGWTDLTLGHGFHQTKQGPRFTISDATRRTILERLLALNQRQYAEGVRAAAEGKRDKKSRRAKRTSPLF